MAKIKQMKTFSSRQSKHLCRDWINKNGIWRNTDDGNDTKESNESSAENICSTTLQENENEI